MPLFYWRHILALREETKARIKKRLKAGIAITSILGRERSKRNLKNEDENEFDWMIDGYLSTSEDDTGMKSQILSTLTSI